MDYPWIVPWKRILIFGPPPFVCCVCPKSQLFVAISEQTRHRKELGNVQHLLRSISSFVVSRRKVDNADKGIRQKFASPRRLVSNLTGRHVARVLDNHDSEAYRTVASAFRLLANLAYSDGPSRRRILEFDGVVLAAADAVTEAVDGISRGTYSAATGGAAESAAALLRCLSTVLGAEGEEDQLVAAGEALAAAVNAVSKWYGGSSANESRSTWANNATQDMDRVALEALSGLLVLSWSDAVNIEAAAAVDWVVTDLALTTSVVSLWRRATMLRTPAGAVDAVDSTAAPTSGAECSQALSSAVLAFLSSIAHRPAGRSALVSAGAISTMLDVILRRRENGGGSSEGVGDLLPVAERAELLRILCVLCATPAHRAVVRESLLSRTPAAARGVQGATVDAASMRVGAGDNRGSGGIGGVVATEDNPASDFAIEDQLVLLQGGTSQLSWECRSGVARLASMLGLSPPPVAIVSNFSSSPAQAADEGAAEPVVTATRQEKSRINSPSTSWKTPKQAGYGKSLAVAAGTTNRSMSSTTRSASPPSVPALRIAAVTKETSRARGSSEGKRDPTANPMIKATVVTATATAVPADVR